MNVLNGLLVSSKGSRTIPVDSAAASALMLAHIKWIYFVNFIVDFEHVLFWLAS